MPHIPGKHTVIDCTYHGGRKQSAILNEAEIPVIEDTEIEVPVSLTPEQLKTYCLQCINSTSNQQKRKVYAEFIKIIGEREELKAKLRAFEMRELRSNALNSDTPDDIQ